MSNFVTATDLLAYSPLWFTRLIADGALAVVSIFPSPLALVLYSCAGFWIVDIAMSFISDVTTTRSFTHRLSSPDPIGYPLGRLKSWVGTWIGSALKAWVGLPTFYVLNLLLSDSVEHRNELTRLLTGYTWQTDALASLTSLSLRSLIPQSPASQIVQLSIVTSFLLYTYWYYAKGFDLVRRIRAVGDALLALLSQITRQTPSLKDAYYVLRAIQWTQEQATAAVWFLAMANARVTMHNPAYRDYAPSQYARFKVTRTFGVAAGLAYLHPIVAGLYVATTFQDVSKMCRTWRQYAYNLHRLPEQLATVAQEHYG